MAARTVYACDRCNAEPSDHFAVDLGNGRKPLDLCEPCQKDTGLTELARVLDEFGAVVASTTPPAKPRPTPRVATGDPWPCPRCSREFSTRTMTLSHLEAIHGLERVEASRLVRPRGEAVDCPDCGYVAQVGTGLSAHVSTQHGPEAWERIRTATTP